MNFVAPHIFRSRAAHARRWESVLFWLLRGATYFVLLCGGSILATIAFRGAPILFKSQAPYINTTFLTAAPESLYVFEYQGKKMEM